MDKVKLERRVMAEQPEERSGTASRGMQPDAAHPVLPIGASFPDFSLPGVDGKTHTR